MVETAYTTVLKTVEGKLSCRFESDLRYHRIIPNYFEGLRSEGENIRRLNYRHIEQTSVELKTWSNDAVIKYIIDSIEMPDRLVVGYQVLTLESEVRILVRQPSLSINSII